MFNTKKILSLAIALLITIASSFLFLDVAEASVSYSGTVDTYVLNVRESPNTSSKILGKLNRNDKVNILNAQNNWGEINYNSKKAFISVDFIKKTTDNSSGSTSEIWVQSKVSSLNMREKADANSKQIGTLKKGEPVKVIGKSGNWAQIIKGTTKAYVHLSYLEESKKTEEISNDKEKNNDVSNLKGKVNANALNIREQTNTKSKIIGALNLNQIVDYQDMKNGWGKIVINGKTGYVSLNYLSPIENNPKEETKPLPNTVVQKVGTVTATTLNVRSEPNTTSNTTGILKNGEKINIEQTNNGWITFTYKNKKSYVSASYVKVENKIEQTKEPIQKEKENSSIGFVTATSLNVREGSSASSKVIGAISKGEKITIHSIENNWAKIAYKKDFGYVSASYIKFEDETIKEEPVIKKEYTYKVKADVLNVRDDKTINGKLIGKLKKGDTLSFVNKNGEWLEIIFNNKKGFVHSNYVETIAREVAPNNEPNVSKGAGLAGKKIVLDAGHGGTDSGAIGNSMKEKDIVLDITLRVKKELEANGAAAVILTRSNDTFIKLNDRVNISNKSGADAFVSVHANSSYYKTANGVETYYYAGNDKLKASSQLLAKSIHEELIGASTMSDRGVKQASFQVIKYNQLPSALLELGFVSNSFDASFLNSNAYKNKVATSVTDGLIDFFDKKQ